MSPTKIEKERTEFVESMFPATDTARVGLIRPNLLTLDHIDCLVAFDTVIAQDGAAIRARVVGILAEVHHSRAGTVVLINSTTTDLPDKAEFVLADNAWIGITQ